MECKRFVVSLIMIAAFGLLCQAAEVENDGFEEIYVRDKKAPEIQAMEKVGWNFQSPLVWPKGWEGSTGVSNVNFAVVQENPHSGKNCILLWGQAGSPGYLLTQVTGLEKGIYKVSFWGRGKGTATMIFAGVPVILNVQLSDKWQQYSGIYQNTLDPTAQEGTLTLQAKIDAFFDDVNVEACNVLEAALVEESTRMRKEGKELALDAKPDPLMYTKDLDEVAQLLPQLKTYADADPVPANLELIRLLGARVEDLKKMGEPTVEQANEAAACARIAKRLEVELQFDDVID